jgi:phosphodiesterase/alkaline phosphatase D-like protein
VGRVRFVLTDTRSARDPAGAPSGAYRSTLGAPQRAWLLDELSRADRYGLVVWVSPDPWIGAAAAGGDSWNGFPEERAEIADALVQHDVDNLLMVAGDAHMLAFDDGSNSDYSTAGGGHGFPVFQAAAVDRPGSVKGGPYTGAVLPGGGQFGEVQVDDDGATVTVTLTGRRWDGRRLLTEVLTFDGSRP